MEDLKHHWENIYSTKMPNEVSWTQEVPQTSLRFIHNANLSKSASIIDVGGGDSRFVDFLLNEGFRNITVLDISEHALSRAKQRLGSRSALVRWISADVTEFIPDDLFDFWHDRAAFHFLTTESQIHQYLSIARRAVRNEGYITIGTFSTDGPKKCSGLDVRQYNEETLSTELQNGFEKIACVTEDHITPFNTSQNFLFCSFKRHYN